LALRLGGSAVSGFQGYLTAVTLRRREDNEIKAPPNLVCT
jgi:hypothetical protein